VISNLKFKRGASTKRGHVCQNSVNRLVEALFNGGVNVRATALFLSLCFFPMSAMAGDVNRPLRIEKFYFMFHPVCWAQAMQGDQVPPLPDGATKEDFLETLALERTINQRQKDFMSGMRPNEALILFPIGESPAMRDLEEHATRVLGRRCVFVRETHPDPPAAWAELSNPIQEFLENSELEGRAEYLKDVPSKIRSELESEIREAVQARGSNWRIGVLEVLYTSRLYAEHLKRQFEEHGLVFNPNTVSSEAFGEGFEQCAVTWKAMLTEYLGFRSPAKNIFDLSVSGARFLRKAGCVERVLLRHDIQLFLWKHEDGRCVGLFMRSRCRLKDPQYYAFVRLADVRLEVWSETAYGTKRWPIQNSCIEEKDGHLRIPVLNGIRRDSTDGSFYIIAEKISFEEFRNMLTSCNIVE